MRNYLNAELYRLLHSKSLFGFIFGCVLILFLSLIFGEMTIMGSGEGMLLDTPVSYTHLDVYKRQQ